MKATNVILLMMLVLLVLLGLVTSPAHASTSWAVEVHNIKDHTARIYFSCALTDYHYEAGSLTGTYFGGVCASSYAIEPNPDRYVPLVPIYQHVMMNNEEYLNCYIIRDSYSFNDETGYKVFECTADRIYKNGFRNEISG